MWQKRANRHAMLDSSDHRTTYTVANTKIIIQSQSLFLSGVLNTGDAFIVLPFSNTIDLIRVKGSNLRKQLEYSVSKYNPQKPGGEFLQFSGRYYAASLIVFSLFKRSSYDVFLVTLNVAL